MLDAFTSHTPPTIRFRDHRVRYRSGGAVHCMYAGRVGEPCSSCADFQCGTMNGAGVCDQGNGRRC